MKNLIRVSLIGILVLTVGLMFTACGGDDNGDPDKDSNGEKASDQDPFIIARAGDSDILDPNYATSEEDMDVVFQIFEGLLRFEDDDLNVGPGLANEWESSEDGKTWTFYLRDDVTFHDGSEFNAEAVEFSFMRVLDEDHEYHGVIDAGWSYLDYLMGDVINDVRAVDDYVVEFELEQKFAPFETYMAYYSQFIVSPEAVKEHGENFVNHPTGTGPFKMVEWDRGDYIRLETYDDYWGELPEIDTLIFKDIPEASTRLMELETGSVDVAKNVPPEQRETLEMLEEAELVEIPGANLFYMALNHDVEPLNDVKVRRAINHAIDVDQIIDEIYQGMATRAINALPPTVFSFDDTAGPYEYDPDKAEELLAEAGYEDGFEIELNTFVYSRTYVDNPVQVAEVIASDLRAVGIDAQIITNEWAQHSDLTVNMEHDLALTGWFDIPYPSNFLRTLVLEAGYNAYQPEELMDMSNEAWATYDEEEQEEIYREIQQRFHEDVPLIPIAHSNYTAAVRNDVEGFVLDTIGIISAHEISRTE
ncbi:ABC transporter substrate-binding protein [Natranaerobius thermophilus]|uniref:4-phytase n=1 Tax=Natranaerobius thermophilus (strain ATCC BAA-1301 / DSM 18059 / JW/NM-WN-LF) TaxID=457570 RepID=B2A294_NATTJ|nr:ABC transporter substrate-binding protein [Natranaerobius thermophilus]ACB86200.1 4-phytase [Natranaerobius thermophilus JW/NM-WN-LF]